MMFAMLFTRRSSQVFEVPSFSTLSLFSYSGRRNCRKQAQLHYVKSPRRAGSASAPLPCSPDQVKGVTLARGNRQWCHILHGFCSHHSLQPSPGECRKLPYTPFKTSDPSRIAPSTWATDGSNVFHILSPENPLAGENGCMKGRILPQQIMYFTTHLWPFLEVWKAWRRQ